MQSETIPQQLQRAYDLIEEAISIIDDVRQELLSGPRHWLDHAHSHAFAALGDIRQELGVTQDLRRNRRCRW